MPRPGHGEGREAGAIEHLAAAEFSDAWGDSWAMFGRCFGETMDVWGDFCQKLRRHDNFVTRSSEYHWMFGCFVET